ncbi:MAG: hypothetical protein CVU39_25355 [Chloroflexi bacterium HGW-Chloroflexi-10]|nr:MAG: hypothetical protein CVU39_25355 [Chloroflexi bacterium HGW-Chloroflexi-10]
MPIPVSKFSKYRFITNLLASLTTGYIFFYFSEIIFWARPRPEDSLSNWLQTWLAYSLMAYVFLVVMRYFRAQTFPAIFLCGALFGWLAEGVVVQTTYESLPLSISFTGLAWHALITTGAGWYTLQRVVRRGWRPALRAGLLLGLFLWFWGITWIYEEPATAVSTGVFQVYTLISTILLMISLTLIPIILIRPFQPTRAGVIVIVGLFVLYFAFIAVPAVPIALAILPVLMLIVLLSLRRNRLQEAEADSLLWLAQPVALSNVLPLVLAPLLASVLYWLTRISGLALPTNWVVYLICTPAGFVLLGWSLWKIWRKRNN